MRSWLSVLFTDAKSKKGDDIPIALSLYSLGNKMDNSLLVVRDINHKYIVVERKKQMEKQRKYELTKEDLETLIFLAANRICDQKKTSEEKKIEICVYAAEITRELIDHLTSENPFDQEQMELVDAVLHKSTTIIIGIPR